MRSDKSHPPAEPIEREGSAPPDHEARRAAFVEAEVDRALELWRGLLPDGVLEALRERAELYLLTDPQMRRALDAAVPRPPADHSEIVPAGGSPGAAGERERPRTGTDKGGS